jgi:hypothetical protein
VPLVAVFAVVGALAIFAATVPGAVFANPAPDGVTNFTLSAEGATSIKLDWDAPDGGETPTGYRIDTSTNGHEWTMLVSSQTETEYTHENLVPTAAKLAMGERDVNRYYRVFALNSHGPGPESDILQETTNGVSEPGAVEGVTATASGATQINLSWSEPEDTGGMPITGYRIVVGDDASVNEAAVTADDETPNNLEANTGSDATTSSHKKLTADTTKYYVVYAINGVGDSTDLSNVASATTGKARRPDPPTGVLAVPVDDVASNGVNLYWLEPENNGGRPIAEFVVQVSVDGGRYRSFTVSANTNDTLSVTTNSAFPNYVHTGEEFEGTDNDITFANEMRVRYRIQAKHEDGTSRASSASRQIALGDLDTEDADAGSVTQRFPADVEVTTVGAASRIDLSWTHDIQTGYRIDVSEDGIKWEELERNTGLTLEPEGTTHTYEHEDGIDPGDMRYYRVFANDGGVYGEPGGSPEAREAGAAAAPTAVRSLSARAANAGQVDLSWSAPSKDGGADIEAYLVQISDDGSTWTPGDAGLGDTIDGDDLVDDMIDAEAKTGFAWVTKKDANDNVVTTYSHKGLAHKSRFYYRVFAYNGTMMTAVAGAGPQTAATPTAGKPGAPMYLSAHAAEDSSLGDPDKQGVYLTWLAPDDPAGAAIDEYEIVRMITGEDDFVDTIPASGTDPRTFYNDTEELGDQVRRYRVRGINAAGEGAWSTTVTYPLADHIDHVTTGALGKPTMVAAVSNVAGQATITWQSGMNADSHDVVLYSGAPDYNIVREEENVTGMSHTFTGVAAGRYAAVVISAMGDDMWDYSLVWVVVQ